MIVILKRIFGADRSTNFEESLPNLSLRGLIFRFLTVSAVTFLITIVGIVLTSSYADGSKISELPDYKFIIITLLYYIAMLVLSIHFFYPKRETLFQQLKSLRLREALKHVLIIGTFLFVVTVITSIITFLGDPQKIEELFKSLNTYQASILGNAFFDIALFTFIWVLTGLAEEVLFRGGLYRTLRNRYSRIISIIVSSLIFLLFHQVNLSNIIFTFILSSTYALYFEYKNNLLTIVILHTLQDLLFAGLGGLAGAFLAKNIISFLN